MVQTYMKQVKEVEPKSTNAAMAHIRMPGRNAIQDFAQLVRFTLVESKHQVDQALGTTYYIHSGIHEDI